MLNNLVEKLLNDYNKAKDKWFLETLDKHNLIKSDNLSNFDLYWLSAEMGVKVIHDEQTTKIFMNDTIIGIWHNNYEVKTDEGKVSFVTKYWN